MSIIEVESKGKIIFICLFQLESTSEKFDELLLACEKYGGNGNT